MALTLLYNPVLLTDVAATTAGLYYTSWKP